MKTAQSIPRIGLARAKGEHLQAANDGYCERPCFGFVHRQGDCACSRRSSARALRSAWPYFLGFIVLWTAFVLAAV